MTFTLTNGTDTITPWDRLGFESKNASRNIIHTHLDNSIGVSLRPDMPRSGSFSLLFLTSADAEAARKLLAASSVWTANDDDPAVEMTFVRDGDLGAAQQDARLRWVLDVGFQELS